MEIFVNNAGKAHRYFTNRKTKKIVYHPFFNETWKYRLLLKFVQQLGLDEGLGILTVRMVICCRKASLIHSLEEIRKWCSSLKICQIPEAATGGVQ